MSTKPAAARPGQASGALGGGSDAVPLYERDFYTWTAEQADLVRRGQFALLDVANLVEELESLGRSERASLESAYRLIALHLLKRMLQPERSTRSWTSTIVRERLRAARVLRDNPGLRPHRDALFRDAYQDARREASAETGMALHHFPEKAPFTLEQMLADDAIAHSDKVKR